MASMSNGTTTWSYTYNADGLRTKRTNGTTTYEYVYNGSQLSQMKYNGNAVDLTYDAGGAPLTLTYQGDTYYYVTNVQGDVIGIVNSSGTKVVSYTYDAWGNILTTTGSMASTLGAYNPLRYRGYVYDTETGLYYLQSRYYDPELGRFINADGYTSTGQGILGNNMFAYCANNPVCYKDELGTRYCAATTVNGESADERSAACAHQNAMAQTGAPIRASKKYPQEVRISPSTCFCRRKGRHL